MYLSLAVNFNLIAFWLIFEGEDNAKSKRRQSPSPERKDQTNKRGNKQKIKRSKSYSNLRDGNTPAVKILKGKSQMNVKEITPRVPQKPTRTIIIDESKTKKQKTVIVDENKGVGTKEKTTADGKNKKDGESVGENEKSKKTGSTSKRKPRRTKDVRGDEDKQKIENNLDKSKDNKKEKLIDKKLSDLTDTTENPKSKGMKYSLTVKTI